MLSRFQTALHRRPKGKAAQPQRSKPATRRANNGEAIMMTRLGPTISISSKPVNALKKKMNKTKPEAREIHRLFTVSQAVCPDTSLRVAARQEPENLERPHADVRFGMAPRGPPIHNNFFSRRSNAVHTWALVGFRAETTFHSTSAILDHNSLDRDKACGNRVRSGSRFVARSRENYQ